MNERNNDIIRKDSDFCELCCNKITAIDQVNSVVFRVSSNIFLVL